MFCFFKEAFVGMSQMGRNEYNFKDFKLGNDKNHS